ncbi:MAG: DUF4149 domain-containing protein [Acidobacteria bacterium]|nr:DUF4149 domain-containing protein [Acidobacteriota bacterium]
MKFLFDIRLLLIGLWLGAAVFFVGVAQSAFAVLPTRELAGMVVNRTLLILNVSGIIIGVLLFAGSLIGNGAGKRVLLWLERVLLVLIVAACAVGQFVLGFWLQLTRAQMGKPVDEVAVDDPLRIQFNNLHNYSEWVLMAAMVAALIAFFVMANRRAVTAASKGTTTDPFDFSKEFKKS